jgi:hypothetical protein
VTPDGLDPLQRALPAAEDEEVLPKLPVLSYDHGVSSDATSRIQPGRLHLGWTLAAVVLGVWGAGIALVAVWSIVVDHHRGQLLSTVWGVPLLYWLTAGSWRRAHTRAAS